MCFRYMRARASIWGCIESGSSKEVRFNRPGPSYIFCNIHPEMSAVIMVMTTPYYATTDAAGDYSIEDVPPGEYEFSVWYESAQPEAVETAAASGNGYSDQRTTGSRDGAKPAPSLAVNHKNKYGQDYEKQPHIRFRKRNPCCYFSAATARWG